MVFYHQFTYLNCALRFHMFQIKYSHIFVWFRRRTLVAIGTHDLDAFESPFTYEVGFASAMYALFHFFGEMIILI